jgi:hypothetical protein
MIAERGGLLEEYLFSVLSLFGPASFRLLPHSAPVRCLVFRHCSFGCLFGVELRILALLGTRDARGYGIGQHTTTGDNMSTTQKERYEVLQRLDRLGIAYDDACALRRIALTLRRWFELECGDGNNYTSWAIERDEFTDIPYMVRHHYRHGMGKDSVSKRRIPDKETGARKRLAALLAKYPALHAYIQTDPRGASLYILTAEQLAYYNKPINSIYNNGIAVY